MSLPRPPLMTSLPSPPISVSLPSPPVIVSLPAPPSMVSWMRVARPLPAVMTSSPPLALTTRFSVVPMSRMNGAGLTRSKRTRVPLAVMVKVSAPLPPLTSAVSLPSPPSMRSLPSPGFQIMRSLPASPNTWSSPVAAGQHVVARAAEQQVVAAFAEQGVVAGLAEQLIVARAAGQHVVARAAEQFGRRQRAVGFVERDRVVAALAEHLDQGGVGDRRAAADDGHGAAVDQNLPGRVAADRDRVLERRRRTPTASRRRMKVGRDSHGRSPSRGCCRGADARQPNGDALAGDRWRSRKSDDGLGTRLRTGFSFSGDVLSNFLVWQSVTIAATSSALPSTRYRPATKKHVAKSRRIENMPLRDHMPCGSRI